MKRARKRPLKPRSVDPRAAAIVTGGGGFGNDLLNADDVRTVRPTEPRG